MCSSSIITPLNVHAIQGQHLKQANPTRNKQDDTDTLDGSPRDPKVEGRPYRHLRTPLQAPWGPVSWLPLPGTRIYRRGQELAKGTTAGT